MTRSFALQKNATNKTTLGRQQSKTLLTIDERGSKISRNSVVGWQMAIENSVSNHFWSTVVHNIFFSNAAYTVVKTNEAKINLICVLLVINSCLHGVWRNTRCYPFKWLGLYSHNNSKLLCKVWVVPLNWESQFSRHLSYFNHICFSVFFGFRGWDRGVPDPTWKITNQ